MNLKMCIKAAVLFSMVSASGVSLAEDWTQSALVGCKTSLGKTTTSKGGLKASGSAVIVCPLTKEVGSSAVNKVYARLNNAKSGGASSMCQLVSTPAFGGTLSFGAVTFPPSSAGSHSINVKLPSQSSTGYMDLYCTMASGDTLYGMRYIQDN